MNKTATKAAAKQLRLIEDEDEGHGMAVEGGYLVSDERLKKLGDGDIKDGRRQLRLFMADISEPRDLPPVTEKPETVRLGETSDELDLFDMLVAHYRENASNVYPLAPEKLISDIQMCTQRQNGCLAGVVDDKEGKPLGVILLGAAQWPASNAWYIREMYTYVKPEHRRSRHGEHLLNFARWCAEEWSNGFGYRVYLGFGMTTQTDNVLKKTRFFRRFAHQIGAYFLYPRPGA